LSKGTSVHAIVNVLIITLVIALTSSASGSNLKLSLATDGQVYDVSEKVLISGNLTLNEEPVSDALVALEIDNPKNETFVIRTLIIGSGGSAPWPIEIQELVPCDAYGNPKNSFPQGGYAGFKIKIKNNAATSYNVISTINLFYANEVPFDAFIFFEGQMDPGQVITNSFWPVPIPSDAFVGDAVAFANIYNKLPRDGGFAYSPEKSAAFSITGHGSGASGSASMIVSLEGSTGTFNLTVGLALTYIRLGNYTIYARTYYQPYIAYHESTFQVRLLGDLFPDGKIDMKDISIVAKAFGSTIGDLNWNPEADLNPDGKIDMKDIAIVAKAFGTQVIDS